MGFWKNPFLKKNRRGHSYHLQWHYILYNIHITTLLWWSFDQCIFHTSYCFGKQWSRPWLGCVQRNVTNMGLQHMKFILNWLRCCLLIWYQCLEHFVFSDLLKSGLTLNAVFLPLVFRFPEDSFLSHLWNSSGGGVVCVMLDWLIEVRSK